MPLRFLHWKIWKWKRTDFEFGPQRVLSLAGLMLIPQSVRPRWTEDVLPLLGLEVCEWPATLITEQLRSSQASVRKAKNISFMNDRSYKMAVLVLSLTKSSQRNNYCVRPSNRFKLLQLGARASSGAYLKLLDCWDRGFASLWGMAVRLLCWLCVTCVTACATGWSLVLRSHAGCLWSRSLNNKAA
jgi:hypothetical protein